MAKIYSLKNKRKKLKSRKKIKSGSGKILKFSDKFRDLNNLKKALSSGGFHSFTHSNRIIQMMEMISDIYHIETKEFIGIRGSSAGLKEKYDIKENEFEYIRLVIIFLDDQTLRVKNLLKDSIQLLKEKKYISSMFILRGFVESCLFDIFITHKLHTHIVNRKVDEFLKIFFRANFAQEEFSVKKMDEKISDSRIKRIINEFEKKKIHINDAINYFKPEKLKKVVEQFSPIRPVPGEDGTVTKSLTGDEYRKWTLNTYKNKKLFNNVLYAYRRLCEIIHPTAISLNREEDAMKSDCTWVLTHTLNNALILTWTFNLEIKFDIPERIGMEKEKFLECFRKY
jgi:hypothetical protein|tara:strand:- start:61 stop:1080 length:1020 start_codon:yes stop_codon:yes gene_type:complete